MLGRIVICCGGYCTELGPQSPRDHWFTTLGYSAKCGGLLGKRLQDLASPPAIRIVVDVCLPLPHGGADAANWDPRAGVSGGEALRRELATSARFRSKIARLQSRTSLDRLGATSDDDDDERQAMTTNVGKERRATRDDRRATANDER